MTDITDKLREPPVMSMVYDRNDLYRIMATRMEEAADEIDRLRAGINHMQFLADRLVRVYGESPSVDFILAARRYQTNTGQDST